MPAARLRPIGPEDDDDAPGHVLARVVTGSLDDDRRTRVAHAASLADDAADEDLAARRAVADDVARDDVLFAGKGRRVVGADDDASTGEALADVVVGVTGEAQRDASGDERAEALTRRTLERRSPCDRPGCASPERPRDRAAGQGADRAVHVSNAARRRERRHRCVAASTAPGEERPVEARRRGRGPA